MTDHKPKTDHDYDNVPLTSLCGPHCGTSQGHTGHCPSCHWANTRRDNDKPVDSAHGNIGEGYFA